MAQAARAGRRRSGIVGLSTHTPAQIDAAARAPRRLHRRRSGARDADQAGPPRRRARAGALRGRARTRCPFFAIGGIDAGERRARCATPGAERIAVVRALTDAGGSRAAARSAARRDSPARWELAQRSRKRGRRRKPRPKRRPPTGPRRDRAAAAERQAPATRRRRRPSRAEARTPRSRAALDAAARPASGPGRSRSPPRSAVGLIGCGDLIAGSSRRIVSRSAARQYRPPAA